MAISALITSGGINLTVNGKTYSALNSHSRWNDIRDAYNEGRYEDIVDIISVRQAINNFGAGKIRVDNNKVYYGNDVLNNRVTEHILRLISDGFTAAPMVAFLENLMQNPSKQAVDELYDFISAAKISITEDGHLLAYKKVRRGSDGNLYDIHTGKISNNVGEIVEMPRNAVNDRREETCSTGLHFCSQSYLPKFGASSGDYVVILKINPRDVVSIPSDYNNAKGRCCRYEVVEMHPSSQYEEIFTKAVLDVKDLNADATKEYAEGYRIGKGVDGLYYDDTSRSDAYRDGYYDGYHDLPYSKRYAVTNKTEVEKAVYNPAPMPAKKYQPYIENYRDGYAQGRSDRKWNRSYDHSYYMSLADKSAGKYYCNGYNDGFYGRDFNYERA